jgi:hypothetical protein
MAAVMLSIIIHRYPFSPLRGTTRSSRTGFFAAALITYSFIISVAAIIGRGFAASAIVVG